MKYRNKHLDRIRIQNLELQCVVGIYDFEKQKTQSLIIHIDMWGYFRDSINKGIQYTADYAKIGAELRFIVEMGQFELLESAAEAMASYLLLPNTALNVCRAQLEKVCITIEKPEAVTKALPSLQIERSVEDYTYEIKTVESGKSIFKECLLFENQECRIKIYTQNLSDERECRSHHMTSLLCLGADLSLKMKDSDFQDLTLKCGEAISFPQLSSYTLELGDQSLLLSVERFSDAQKKYPDNFLKRNYYQEA